MKPLKTIAASAFAAAFFSTVALANGAQNTNEQTAQSVQIVAKINSQIITNYDVQLYANALGTSTDAAFATLLRERIITHLLEQRRMRPSKAQIDLQMAQELKNMPQAQSINGDELAFVRSMAEAKISQKLLYDDIVATAKILPPSDEEVRDFYAKNVAPQGLAFESEEQKIRAFLFNQSAERAIANFLEREEGRAHVEILE